jgi:hypothetical protein
MKDRMDPDVTQLTHFGTLKNLNIEKHRKQIDEALSKGRQILVRDMSGNYGIFEQYFIVDNPQYRKERFYIECTMFDRDDGVPSSDSGYIGDFEYYHAWIE